MTEDQLRQEALDACHGLAAYGLGSGIGGHVSVRVPGKPLYWTNALDRTFEEMRLEDIVLMDFDGRPVRSDRPISPGIGFHQGIYKLRPDVGAIAHTHGFWITAQSAYGRPLRNLHNLATYFHGRTAVAPDDEIESIAPAMKAGDNAIIIPWHGAITMGADMPEAAALHVTLDYACRLDVTMPDGVPLMPEDHARTIQGLLAKANYLTLTWDLMRRKAERGFNGSVVVPQIAA
jgi:ribulose-5-phosphate 4-epimerase/fuculose-1-phosphate aldolase